MTDDLDRIMAVMAAAFDPVFGEAWTRRQVDDALAIGRCEYILIAADGRSPLVDEPAVGFSLSRPGFDEEELLLFSVHPQHRRRGLGLKLLQMFMESARLHGAQRLLLEMRRGNPAEALYRGFGFVAVGERRNYYRQPDGGKIDAITFCYLVDAVKHDEDNEA